MSSRDLKRKAMSVSKNKANAAPPAAAAAAAGVSRLPHRSGSSPAPNLAGFNGVAAPFLGHGSSSSPTPNSSAGTIHPQSLADGLDSSPIHGRRGYLVGFGAVASSHGRCASTGPSSPFGHQSNWDPVCRLFTSGYSDQMWIDAADKFYLIDNKKAKLGPFVLKNVWKICREVPKWKTYNEDLRNVLKRKSYHIEGEVEEDDDIEEMPERPIGQKAAKKAAHAAKGKSKGSNLDDDGKAKESAIDVEKLDKFSKIQEDLNANRMKVLELQQKLSTEKLETTRLAHLTAKETTEAKRLKKESKMMHAYNTLISQDTSSMSDEEKAERVATMKCFRKTLFLEMI
ncbi:unnamed protein product [Miscanthus lutarioriparius]|uniref:No apical meristem-associated C-terminal domain-containing protein n=1 Tax=Miscanthus lutarioriparius TaxID=422564 RepID=A0A811RER6_9POAL|nr:unnamed protein product [Miscanthus lutarioriparius]